MRVSRGEMQIMNAERERAAGDRVGEVHDRRSDGHANGAQIVREPRHQIAGAHAGEVRWVERLEVSKEVVAKIVLDPPAHAVQQLRIQ